MPIFTSEQITQALIQTDLLNICRKGTGYADEYELIARGVYASLLEGFSVKEALVFELVEWLFENEDVGTECLDPVVAYLNQKEG